MALKMKREYKYKKSYSNYKKAMVKFAKKNDLEKPKVSNYNLLSKKEYEKLYTKYKEQGDININRKIIKATREYVSQPVDLAYKIYKRKVSAFYERHKDLGYESKQLTKSQFGVAFEQLTSAGTDDEEALATIVDASKYKYTRKQTKLIMENIREIRESVLAKGTRTKEELYKAYGETLVNAAVENDKFTLYKLQTGKAPINPKDLAKAEYDRLTRNRQTGEIEYEYYQDPNTGKTKRRRKLENTLAEDEELDPTHYISETFFGSL